LRQHRRSEQAVGEIMNLVWRFYVDEKRRWKWQQLSVGHQVISESQSAYKAYEDCLEDAKQNGYVFQPSRARLMPGSLHPSNKGKLA
jgi:hypothetical protein